MERKLLPVAFMWIYVNSQWIYVNSQWITLPAGEIQNLYGSLDEAPKDIPYVFLVP
jgi:hypothetical protein